MCSDGEIHGGFGTFAERRNLGLTREDVPSGFRRAVCPKLGVKGSRVQISWEGLPKPVEVLEDAGRDCVCWRGKRAPASPFSLVGSRTK